MAREEKGRPGQGLGITLRVHLIDGAPDGLRIVERANSTALALACLRSRFRTARQRPEFRRPGVYILVGGPERDGRPVVYVGEGDPVLPRLEAHHAKKGFWTSLALFASKDNGLNKAHIQHVEARLLGLAREAGRCELDNGNLPQLPSLSEAETAEAEGFLSELLLSVSLLGLRVFERRPAGEKVVSLRGGDDQGGGGVTSYEEDALKQGENPD